MSGFFDDLIPQPPQPVGGRFADLVPKDRAMQVVQLQRTEAPSAFVMGMADSIHGGAQLLTKILPDGVVSAGNDLNNWLADNTGLVARIPEGGVDQMVREREAAYQDARRAATQPTISSLVTGERDEPGVDWGRLAGSLLSPANLAISAAAPVRAVTALGKVAQGARVGALGAAAAPVTDPDADFVGAKVGQILTGAVAGGALTPIAGKVGEIVARYRNRSDPQAIAQQTDDIINAGIERLQREGVVLPQPQIAALRQQVADSLRKGVALDAAAVARKADFDALGMQPTLGQITRDAAQFSREKNLRGVAGVGEPLLARFEQQGNRLQELVAGPARGAADDFNAGQQMMGALRRIDDSMSGEVGAAYGAARDHLGRAAPMDSNAFSTAANTLLDEQMLGSALPREGRKILNDVTTGKVPLTVNSTVLIDRRLSQLQRDMARQGNGSAEKALGVMRDALNKAPVADNVGADAKAAFDVARGLARDRFKTHEMVPALKAAIDGDVSAQDFVRRFLVNGKPEEVARLAKVLPPDMRDEARRQLSAAMERAAFGANTSGDKAFAQESFNRLLQSPGMRQRLGAFFTPDEVAQLDRIGRVAAYTTSFPANSTVNTSNTAAAVANLVSRVPGLPAGVGLLQSAKNAAGNQMAVRSAMAAQPGQRPTPLTPEQQAVMARLLGFGAAGAGGATGAGVGR